MQALLGTHGTSITALASSSASRAKSNSPRRMHALPVSVSIMPYRRSLFPCSEPITSKDSANNSACNPSQHTTAALHSAHYCSTTQHTTAAPLSTPLQPSLSKPLQPHSADHCNPTQHTTAALPQHTTAAPLSTPLQPSLSIQVFLELSICDRAFTSEPELRKESIGIRVRASVTVRIMGLGSWD